MPKKVYQQGPIRGFLPMLFLLSGCLGGPDGEMGGTAIAAIIQGFVEAVSHYFYMALGVTMGTLALLLLLWFLIRKK